MAEELVAATVTLTDPPQAGVPPIAFSIAARLLAGPVGVASESEGGTSFTYAAGVGVFVLTAEEIAALRRATCRPGGLGEIGLTTPGAYTRRFDIGWATECRAVRRY